MITRASSSSSSSSSCRWRHVLASLLHNAAASSDASAAATATAGGSHAAARAYSSSSSTGPAAYSVAHLASRGVISLQGPDAVEFLQGLTTNDVRPLEQPGAGPVYSVLLTAKGKFLHDLFAYSLLAPPGNGLQQQQQEQPHHRLLLDVHAGSVGAALAWLSKYKLRRKVQLADASGQYSVWAAFADQAGSSASSLTPGGPWRQDPRHGGLGLRGVFDAQQLPPPPQSAGGTTSRKQLAAGMSIGHEAGFRQLRWSLGIAEGDVEMPSGQVAPLECNLDALTGVSYTKGCYIGQERNSYTHYRGIIRRRCMPLQLLSPTLQQDPETRLPCPVPIVASPGKPAIGTLTAQEGGAGIGFVKLSAVAALIAQNQMPSLELPSLAAAALGGSRVGVHAQRPSWWPHEWGREEETAEQSSGQLSP